MTDEEVFDHEEKRINVIVIGSGISPEMLQALGRINARVQVVESEKDLPIRGMVDELTDRIYRDAAEIHKLLPKVVNLPPTRRERRAAKRKHPP